MKTQSRRFLAALALAAAGCGIGAGAGEAPQPEDCRFDLRQGAEDPLYPDGFDYDAFVSTIQPLLAQRCATPACHAAAAPHPPSAGADFDDPYGVYLVWRDAGDNASTSCGMVETFNHFIHQLDYRELANSPLLAEATGSVSHAGGVVLEPGSPEYQTLLDFIVRRRTEDVPYARFFDRARFAAVIQPALDDAGCSAGGTCHGQPESAGSIKFALFPAPVDPAAIEANFLAVVGAVTLEQTANSLIYYQATTPHLGSAAMSDKQAAQLLDWIQDAAEAKCNRREGCPDEWIIDDCIPTNRLDALAFENEILPILDGADPYGIGAMTGCSRPTCHGNPALDMPGKFYLGDPDDTSPERVRTALRNFACGINLQNPAYSQVVLCPLDAAACSVDHPGGNIFAGTADLYYQRILSYILAASSAPPYDFAFFAEKINPVLFTPNANNQTCADLGQCHGVNDPGQLPPNGSDFPILVGSDLAALTYNFVQAASFTNFFDPDHSPLVLYPTNTIGDLIPGEIHPPGPVIDIDDQQAQDIVTWAGGLRLDAQGFNRNWLVAGEFLVSDGINDSPLPALEAGEVTPRVFEPSGGVGSCQGSPCQWQSLFAAAATIDLNGDDFFPRDVSIDRTAYAVVYVVNVSGRDIEDANLLVTTDPANDLEVYVGGQLAGSDANGVVNAAATFPTVTLGATATATPVAVKLFQPAGEPGVSFAFTARFLDKNDQPIAGDALVLLLNSYADAI